MSTHPANCLTDRHLLLFGAIVQCYARYELLIQAIIVHVTGSDAATVLLLMCDSDFNTKRRTVLDLLRHRSIPMDQYDRVGEYLMVAHTHTGLLHDIAHANWVLSASSDSVQPDWILHPRESIKPLRDDPLAPDKPYIEREEDKIAYTLEDLDDIRHRLEENRRWFSDYLLVAHLVSKSGLLS